METSGVGVVSALEELVRQAMASGAVCFCERVGKGEVDLSAPRTHSLGDFPAEFIKIRTDLIDDLRREWGVS